MGKKTGCTEEWGTSEWGEIIVLFVYEFIFIWIKNEMHKAYKIFVL